MKTQKRKTSVIVAEELTISAIARKCEIDDKTGCLVWPGMMGPPAASGIRQPRMYVVYDMNLKSMKTVQVRRWIYTKTEGVKITAPGIMVLPSCGSERCVSPEHARAVYSSRGVPRGGVINQDDGNIVAQGRPESYDKRIPQARSNSLDQFKTRVRIDAYLHGMMQ